MRTLAHLDRPVGGKTYAARTAKGEIRVNLTASQFLSVYDNGGAFFVDGNNQFLTRVEK